MARRRQGPQKPKLNLDTFSDGIKGKVLEAVSITNEQGCRYISLEFQDKTELTITLNIGMKGKLELSDWSAGDERPIRKIGRIPDDAPAWQPRAVKD